MVGTTEYRHHGLFLVLVFSLLAHSLLVFWLKDEDWFSDNASPSQAHQALSFSIAQPTQTARQLPEALTAQQPSSAIESVAVTTPEPVTELITETQIVAKPPTPEPAVKPQSTETRQQKNITDSDSKSKNNNIKTYKNNNLEKIINADYHSPKANESVNTVNQPGSQSQTEADAKIRYLEMLMQQIEKKKFYPRSARRRHVEGQIIVNLLLNEEGFVQDIKLEKGHKLLKQATRKAILDAQPFAPPPVSIDLTQALRFVIAYELK